MTTMTQSESDLILHTMLAMAAADGHADERETATIAGIYRDITGREISEADIAHAAEVQAATDSNLIAELSAAAKQLDRPAKEHIIRAAYLVLLADDNITAPERKKLRDIADALRVPEVHFGAIMEDLAIWLANQGR